MSPFNYCIIPVLSQYYIFKSKLGKYIRAIIHFMNTYFAL